MRHSSGIAHDRPQAYVKVKVCRVSGTPPGHVRSQEESVQHFQHPCKLVYLCDVVLSMKVSCAGLFKLLAKGELNSTIVASSKPSLSK